MSFEYKGFKCTLLPTKQWRVEFPAGNKFTAPAQSEEQLKAVIDSLVSQ